MILVVLEVNGKIRAEEFKNRRQANKKVLGENGWLEEAKKNFPHKEFIPVFYQAKRLS